MVLIVGEELGLELIQNVDGALELIVEEVLVVGEGDLGIEDIEPQGGDHEELLEEAVDVAGAAEVAEADEAMSALDADVDGVHVVLIELLVVLDDGVEELEEVVLVVVAGLNEEGERALASELPLALGVQEEFLAV